MSRTLSMLATIALLAACDGDGDPCAGLRCAGNSVNVTVASDVPITTIAASASGLELTCQDVSASFGATGATRWACYGRPDGPGDVEVTVEADGRTETVTVDVVERETECCGTLAEGTTTLVLGGDAGA